MQITRWIFLGGPIMHALSEHGYKSEWRSVIESTIDLLKTQGYLVRSALTEGYLDHGMSLEAGGSSEQAVRDYKGVIEASCYVALWPSEDGAPTRSDGMCIEIGWATQAGVPCVLIRDMAARHSDMILGLNAISSVQHLDYFEFFLDRSKLLPLLDRVWA